MFQLFKWVSSAQRSTRQAHLVACRVNLDLIYVGVNSKILHKLQYYSMNINQNLKNYNIFIEDIFTRFNKIQQNFNKIRKRSGLNPMNKKVIWPHIYLDRIEPWIFKKKLLEKTNRCSLIAGIVANMSVFPYVSTA